MNSTNLALPHPAGQHHPPAMGNRIKELRLKAGLTLDQLAERVGTTNQQISRLEKGERRLTQGWMEKIGPALGVPAPALIAPDGSPVGMAEGVMRLIVPPTREEDALPHRMAVASAALDAMLEEEGIPLGRRAFVRLTAEVAQEAFALGPVSPYEERVALIVSERRSLLRRQLGKD